MAQGQRSTAGFPAYRRHEDARREANSAIMGLLVGSRIAAHFLTPTDGSTILLPAIFPAIDHVRRFNLTSQAARDVLVRADVHLGTMAIPYALAIHEDFLRSCLHMLGKNADQPRSGALHATLTRFDPIGFDADPLAQYHVVREMRNAVIHNGGSTNQRVIGCIANLSPRAESAWKKIVGRSPRQLRVGDRIELGVGELFLTLAATKRLGRQANQMVVRALAPQQWAEVIVRDFVNNHPEPIAPQQRWRKLIGWQRFHYAAVGITDEHLRAAAAMCGVKL